jgi:hypothetical protein
MADTPIVTPPLDEALQLDLQQLLERGLIEIDEASEPDNPRVRPTPKGLQAFVEQATAEGDPLARVVEVVAAIERETGGKPGHGVTRCPCCQGRLHYNWTTARGATAFCETRGCVRFMS